MVTALQEERKWRVTDDCGRRGKGRAGQCGRQGDTLPFLANGRAFWHTFFLRIPVRGASVPQGV